MSDSTPSPADDPSTAAPPLHAEHSGYAGLRTATIAVASGRPPRVPDAPLNEPLTMASTFVAGGDREYGRYGNPGWQAFETALGALEGGRALAFSSGMAAVATLFDLVGHGTTVVCSRQAYQGSLVALGDLEARGRLSTALVDITDVEAVRAACGDDAALVWIESPTNPLLEVADIAAITEVAHAAGAYVVVDNTLATPLLQRPLELGVDLVVHSATKYLSGHSDALLGAVVTRDEELFGVLKNRRDLVGSTPGGLECYLALRGLRTLPLRFERASANAAVLAERLAAHPQVERVRYPGSGAMLAFEVAGGPLAADLLVRSTRLWVHTTSLGGVESTFERRRRWRTESSEVPESLIRASVGIEDVEDLWSDLSTALEVDPSVIN